MQDTNAIITAARKIVELAKSDDDYRGYIPGDLLKEIDELADMLAPMCDFAGGSCGNVARYEVLGYNGTPGRHEVCIEHVQAMISGRVRFGGVRPLEREQSDPSASEWPWPYDKPTLAVIAAAWELRVTFSAEGYDGDRRRVDAKRKALDDALDALQRGSVRVRDVVRPSASRTPVAPGSREHRYPAADEQRCLQVFGDFGACCQLVDGHSGTHQR